MNVRDLIPQALVLLVAVGGLGTGLALLVEPAAVGGTLGLHPGSDEAGDDAPLLRRLGAAYTLAGAALVASLRGGLTLRRTLHLGTLAFFGLLAALRAGELAAAGVPVHDWFAQAPLVLLPPLLLALALVRLPARITTLAGVQAGSEEGVIKWFDGRKGFGFITRANGEELFVHYRSISDAHGGSRALRDGQPVSFRVGQGKKGPQAEDVVPLTRKA